MAIISTAIMASSTSRPKARIRAPSEILCSPTSNKFMPAKVIAKTKGMEKATTKPVRKPNEKKLTNKTIMTASASTLTNSWILRCTATGWSETFCSFIPRGKVFCSWANSVSRFLPKAIISPPLRIDTAIPIPLSPIKRIRG